MDQKSKSATVLTIIALVILSIGALFSLGGSLLMFGVSVISLALPLPFDSGINLFSSLSSTTMLAVFGCLSIPGIIFLAQKLSRKYQPKPSEEQDPFEEMPFSRMLVPNVVLAATILMLAVIYLLSTRFEFVLWVLPFLQIPAIIAPIYWIYHFTMRRVYPRPAKRHWIALGLDLTLQPILAMVFELALLIAMIIPIMLWVAINPDLLEELMGTFQQFQNIQFMSMDEIEAIAASWLENPWIIFFIQLFVAGLVPLAEELLKPMLVWRWLKRPLTPMDGFWLGLIGGAAFTLYENFGNLGSMSVVDEWYFLLIARIGTSILHMGTSALMGWALMKTFSDKKWRRVIGTYAVSVLLHGAWNFSAIIQGFATLPMENPPDVFILSPFALPVLFLIGAMCALVLIFGAGMIQKDEQLTLLENNNTNEAA